MNIFKMQHPQDLISRLFVLEYMREVDTKVLYAKANKYQKEKFFYTYTVSGTGPDVEEEEHIDINWEYCLFVATLFEIENFMSNFLEEMEAVEAGRAKFYQAAIEHAVAEKMAEPVDINIMDLAQTEINKSKDFGFKSK